MDLQWNEINLFTNDFSDPVGDVLFQESIDFTIDLPAMSFSPSSSLQCDLSDIGVNSFRSKEKQLLPYLQEKNQIDLSKLPTKDELQEIYSIDSTISNLDSILFGYEKKIDLLSKHPKVLLAKS